MKMPTPIETEYAGCRFRSRLEARWAVFFDHLSIAWQYEPQGFVIDVPVDGLPDGDLADYQVRYLPDFLLPDCGTWIEVKGAASDLDRPLMLAAARQLPTIPPRPQCEAGPRLMILGPIPRPTPEGDWGWIGIHHIPGTHAFDISGRYGFGTYYKNRRPWWLDNPEPAPDTCESWLTPTHDPYEVNVSGAYRAARSARFEYGENGALASLAPNSLGRHRNK